MRSRKSLMHMISKFRPTACRAWTSDTTSHVSPVSVGKEKINKLIEAAFEEVMQQGADLTNLLVGADPFKELPF